jgi:protein ImuA
MPGLEELLTHPGIWRGREAGSPTVPTRPSGLAQLDQALQGGWPRGQLTELIGGPFGSGETRILLPMLAACTRDQRRVVLVGPPATPWIPGWRQLGVDPELVLMIRTATEEDAVWSCEQILRQPGTGALLAWLRGTDGAPLRRLRLAASAGDACAFLYRPPAAAQQPSPAHLRIRWQGAGDHLRLEVIKQTGGWLPRNQPVMIPQDLLHHRCNP